MLRTRLHGLITDSHGLSIQRLDIIRYMLLLVDLRKVVFEI